MENIVELNKSGYDPFITFMKGYAILCVLLAHALPDTDVTGYAFWGGMQVPLFLIIQVFHSFKRKPVFNIGKIFKRAVLPFLLVQLIIIGLIAFSLRNEDIWNRLINGILVGGGLGPGSYYFWIYLQFAVLLPLLYPLLVKIKRYYLLILFLLISECCEVLSSLILIPDPIYRLLCLRYLFLIYLGIEWVQRGIVLNWKTLTLSLLSIGSIAYFTYFAPTLEPFFFKTSWCYHRWICYFYVAYLLAWFLSVLFGVVKNMKWVNSLFRLLGESSYEIYVFQMAVFVLFSKSFLFFLPYNLIIPIWIFLTITISIFGGYFFHRFGTKYVLK